MSGYDETRWRAAGCAPLAWRAWDDEFVVFNPRTGSTHLLSELAGEVLRGLMASEQGVTIEALAARLAGSADGVDAADWAAAITVVLADFARLELAETVSP